MKTIHSEHYFKLSLRCMHYSDVINKTELVNVSTNITSDHENIS